MPYLKTPDGLNLFYHDWGQGRPVVLIHGWPLNADMWEYQMPFLAKQGLRVIAYDRRGFGRSDQPWEGYDYDVFADDLHALMEGLDLTGAMLVGFSMGGGEVARYLARHGGARVAKVALVGAVTPYMLATGDNPEGVPASVFDEMIEGLMADRPNFLASFGKTFFGAGVLNFNVSNEILDWALMHALKASPKATLDCVRAFSETDFRKDLAALTMPTLIVHGTSDATVPVKASARRVTQFVPHAEIRECDGAPHGLFYTHKDELNADLLAFASR